MTAICKTIAVHAPSARSLLKYCRNDKKVSLSQGLLNTPDLSVSDLLNYAANPLKTICNIDENHKELLISGIRCHPETAAQEFAFMREQYRIETGRYEVFVPFEFMDRRTGQKRMVQKSPVTAIHLIQSFGESNLDPHLVHQIGIDLVEALGVQAVVDTHLNKNHLHNHIIINAYQKDRKVLLNKAFILKTRELSDDIQRNYNIPIEFDSPVNQLYMSKHKGTYQEWKMEQAGLSWKEQMRQDINMICSIAKDRNEYLSMMESYGYKVIASREKDTTFYCEESGKKIRDRTLGPAYAIENLYPLEMDPVDSSLISQQSYHYSFRPSSISVARYDSSGRRRSDLEILLRKALRILQKVKALLQAQAYTQHTTPYKIRQMKEALEYLQKYEITTQEELSAQLQTAGATLSHTKSQLLKKESEYSLYQTLQAVAKDLEFMFSSPLDFEQLYLHTFDKEETRKNRAKLAPLPPSMASKIAIALHKNPDYKLACRYNELSVAEAEDILSFLKDGKGLRPSLLLESADYEKLKMKKLMDVIYKKRNLSLKDKFQDIPASAGIKREVEKTLKANGIAISTDQLSQYDAQNILQCMGDNPFCSPLIDEKEQDYLQNLLLQNGAAIHRDLSFITKKELWEIRQYFDGSKTKQPILLQPFVNPQADDVEALRHFMDLQCITSTVAIDALSKPDFQRLYSYVIGHGRQPDILQETTQDQKIFRLEQDQQFEISVAHYSPNDMLYFYQLRNSLNYLRSLGIDIQSKEDLEQLKQTLSVWESSYESLKSQKALFSNEYRELFKVKQALQSAESHSFLYGELEQATRHDNLSLVAKDPDILQDEADIDWDNKENNDYQNDLSQKHMLDIDDPDF